MESFLAEWNFIYNSRILTLIATSVICGALIGLEREHSAKPAGLRTNIMICVGATLFTVGSILSANLIAGAPHEAGRIAAQVVSGVGFIGAGAILRAGPRITGITTAATIWLVAAIGIVVGLGFPLLGLIISGVATLMLFVLGKIEFAHPVLSAKTKED